MEITISVTPGDYECLLNHVPDDSPMDRLLRTAAVVSHSGADAIYQTYEIICDETEFDELRKTAQRHCPDVASKIDEQ